MEAKMSHPVLFALLGILIALNCNADQTVEKKSPVAAELDSGGCKRNQFHCSKRRRCIPAGNKCNYDNDCGDGQDEAHCNEKCHTRYTAYQYAGRGYLVHLDRHHLSCRSGESMKMFHLQHRRRWEIRYQYTCCKLNKRVCSNKIKYNKYTFATDYSGANYLARQLVSCGRYGYVSSLRLRRAPRHNKIRYVYNCCYLHSLKHKLRTSCYSGHTNWTFNRDETTFYLSTQTVRCKPRYFLSEFRLKNKYALWSPGVHFRYYYRCCRIKS